MSVGSVFDRNLADFFAEAHFQSSTSRCTPRGPPLSLLPELGPLLSPLSVVRTTPSVRLDRPHQVQRLPTRPQTRRTQSPEAPARRRDLRSARSRMRGCINVAWVLITLFTSLGFVNGQTPTTAISSGFVGSEGGKFTLDGK